MKIFLIFIFFYFNVAEILVSSPEELDKLDSAQVERQALKSKEFQKQEILNKNNYKQLKSALALFRKEQLKKEKQFETKFQKMIEQSEKYNVGQSSVGGYEYQKLFKQQTQDANKSIQKIRDFLKNKTSKFDHEKEFDWEFLERLIQRDPELDYPTYNDDKNKN